MPNGQNDARENTPKTDAGAPRLIAGISQPARHIGLMPISDAGYSMSVTPRHAGPAWTIRWTVGFLLLASTIAAGRAQTPEQGVGPATPPMPFEDVGACPFEGCVYREWIANSPVVVSTDRRVGAPVAFTLKTGDHVLAITGIVVTTKPGRVQFRNAVDLWTTGGTIHVEPTETLYLLTYHGEGSTTAWFKGRLYDQVDGSEFFNSLCQLNPGSCNGRIVERPQRVWWVRLRTMRGLTGWTKEPEKFDNKDLLG